MLQLNNGEQSIRFAELPDGGYRPEWLRVGERPMLRFKDHEWLNIGAQRVTRGELLEQTDRMLLFGGSESFAGISVAWKVRISLPADGLEGFTIRTGLSAPEDVEFLEALTSFETPYEYDGTETSMLVMCQQPVYLFEAGQEKSGAGFMQPLWYYGRKGRGHLTAPSASPIMSYRVQDADGANERCVQIIGNWNICALHDMFSQPTRALKDTPEDLPYPDAHLTMAPGKHGTKFLVGALNWNNSLHKDPNVLVEAGEWLRQEQIVSCSNALPGGHWDTWLATGWERLCRIHFPADGQIGAYDVARSRGASWGAAAEWLAQQLNAPEGCTGFVYPESGTCVYAPGTRPQWGGGSEFFAGQFSGPLAYLGHVLGDEAASSAAERMETFFAADTKHAAEALWVNGVTPFYVNVLRKGLISGLQPQLHADLADKLKRRSAVMLNPPEGRRPDPGMLAFEAMANYLAAKLYEADARDGHFARTAAQLMERVNGRLDADFWTYNCAVEGDLVGAGGARPFGHGAALAANWLAYQHTGEALFLENATRFGDLLLGQHCIAYNESPAPDLDTRGWCHGSTAGRDQTAQLPPWETGLALQQFGLLLLEGVARPGQLDALWLFAHTGLAQFPAARSHKRLYRPDMSITYRPIEHLASEREFYLKLPYLAYENPWDQTMLAGYQGVEPLTLAPFFGGALVHCADHRVLALVPAVVAYDTNVAERFTAYLWNPLGVPIETQLCAPVAARRGETWCSSGAVAATYTGPSSQSESFTVPPRQLVTVQLQRA